MIARLYSYFGIIGVVSILLWVAALAVALVGAPRGRRYRWLFAALGLLAAAWGFAHVNSLSVSAIRLDQRAEIEASKEALRRVQEDAEMSGKVRVRFAEDAPGEADAIAGMRKGEPAADALATPETATLDAGEKVPAYRLKGKQARKTASGGTNEVFVGDRLTAEQRAAESKVRMLKSDQLVEANRLDHYNLLAVRGLFWLVLFAIAIDYLWRFGRPFRCYFPLPISSHWIDAHFARPHAVWIASDAPETWGRYVSDLVRKGESFIDFGPDGAVPAALPRLRLWRLRLANLPVMTYGAPGQPDEGEFVFDAAWFGRCGVGVRDPETSRRLIADLEAYLRMRSLTHAVARRPVHLAWRWPDLPPAADVERLMRLCRETNWTFVVLAPHPPPPSIAGAFDDVVTGSGTGRIQERP